MDSNEIWEVNRNEKTLWQALGLHEPVKYLEIKYRPNSPEKWDTQDLGIKSPS